MGLLVFNDLVRGLFNEVWNRNGHLRWKNRFELKVFCTRNVRRQLCPIYRVLLRVKGAVGLRERNKS